MSLRLSKIYLVLMFVLVFPSSNAWSVESRTVVVNGGTLANPIGVGYDVWEGLQALEIKLSASPGEIATAQLFAPEDVIWDGYPPSGGTWVFDTAALKPDEAFATIFKGTLKNEGEGTGAGSTEWAVAVSDIDLDCDSDNDSSSINRPPSESDAEDACEYSTDSGSSSPPGLELHALEWAKMTVKANVKRRSTFQLKGDLFGLEYFEIADDAFGSLAPVGGKLFEQTLEPGLVSRTFYIRPKASVATGSQVQIQAVLDPEGPSGSLGSGDQIALDKITVSKINSPPEFQYPPNIGEYNVNLGLDVKKGDFLSIGDFIPAVATDADNDPLTYTINPIDPNFEIDSNSGNVKLKKNAIDLEFDYYEIPVEVTDGFEPVSTVVKVNVKDAVGLAGDTARLSTLVWKRFGVMERVVMPAFG